MSKTKRNILLIGLAILILLIASAAIQYRKISWEITDAQRADFINECANYSNAAFCDCFISDLNTKLPASKIMELRRHNASGERETEQQSVNTCKMYE